MTHTKEIIEKYFKGNADKKTSALFVEWFSAPMDANLKENLIWDEWETDAILSKEETMRSYAQVMGKIRKRSLIRSFKFWSCAVAASLVFAALFYACFPKLEVDEVDKQTLETIKMTECYVANGEKKVVSLPDSTTVLLNSGSLLIYPEKFNSTDRQVYLIGEAIFDVTKNPGHAFVVNTPDFSIKVHGTVFNVSSYSDSNYSTTTLKSGSISVLGKNGDQFLLSPGQTLKYAKDSNKVSINQSDVDDAFAWKDGKLYFKSASIHTIINTLERYYGLQVYLTNPKYGNEHLTAKFIHGETVEVVLTVLCRLVPGMKWHIENSTVYIK